MLSRLTCLLASLPRSPPKGISERAGSGKANWLTFYFADTVNLEIIAEVFVNAGSYLFQRASSHTRLKANDHGNVIALIGRKGGDHPSSLHTRRWRPKGPKKSSWMKNLNGVLQGKLWIRLHGLLEFASDPWTRGGCGALILGTPLRGSLRVSHKSFSEGGMP